ncbi:MAG: translocation/assembly module TamB domain-containing protein [Pseudomonadota bacterium]
MRRAVIILAASIAVLVTLGVVIGLVLFNTEPGRQFIVARAETAIEGVIGGSVEIGRLDGELPGEIILGDIQLLDEQGAWMTIDTVHLIWRPISLIRKEINIDEISIKTATLMRRPPPDDTPDEARAALVELPDALPKVRIGSINIIDFRNEFGLSGRLDGVGAVQLGGRAIKADITLTSAVETDQIDLSLDFDPDTDKLHLDGALALKGGGVIASLTRFDSPVILSIQSEGTARNGRIEIEGDLGAIGAINAGLAGDFDLLSRLNLSLDIDPGKALKGIEALNGPVVLRATLEDERAGGALVVQQLALRAGDIAGSVAWMGDHGEVDGIVANLDARFAEDYLPALQATIGDTLSLRGDLRARAQDFGFEADLKSDRFVARMSDGATDLSSNATGNLFTSLTPGNGIQLLDDGADLSARIAIAGAIASLETFALTLKSGASLDGALRVNPDDFEIDLTAEGDAAPSFIAALTPSIALTDSAEFSISLEGPPDRLTLLANAALPDARIDGTMTPAIDVDIALAGLPNLPTGKIEAKARQGEGLFLTELRSAITGRVSAPVIQYEAAAFRLKGSGAYDPNAQAAEIDLSYKGDAGAAPWPGLNAAGALDIAGRISRSGADTQLRASADQLVFGGLGIVGLDATAAGPPAAVQLDLSTDAVSSDAIGAIEDIQTSVRLNLTDNPSALFLTLSGVAGDSDFDLRAPARVLFENGLTIEDLHLGWGENGDILLDASISETRWRADADLRNVLIPGADGLTTLNLYLDTDEPIPARGAFELRSLSTQNPDDTLKGALIWNGETLNLASPSNADNLQIALDVPARLVRSPELTLDTAGDLDGNLRYDGDLNVIAGFFPPILQTLEGGFKADLAIAGPISSPALEGDAQITNGAFTELQSGFSVAGLNASATARFSDKGSALTFAGAARGASQSREETIMLDGEISLGRTPRMRVDIGFDDAVLSALPIRTVRINGALNIEGPTERPNATGEIRIDELDAAISVPENVGLAPIDVVKDEEERRRENGAVIAPPAAPGFEFDLSITADDRIFIRGRGLESEWAANIQATDDRDTALISGSMSLRRGWFDFSGRRFDLSRGDVSFDRLSPNNPLLDIQADYATGDGVTAIIAVSGRADDPKIELTSTPSLPSEDIMALVLFGKPAADLTAFESLMTAQAFASLAGIGPFGGDGGVTGALRRAVGLDLLSVDVDTQTGAGALTVGKYVADGFFVSATQDSAGESGAVRLQYELTDNVTIETETRQDGDQTVSANWKRDF